MISRTIVNVRVVAVLLACVMSVTGKAATPTPSYSEWRDLSVNEINRLPVHASFFAFESSDLAMRGDKHRSERYLSLDGEWRFRWVEHADERHTDFYLPDLDDGNWDVMSIPAMWELHGYGSPEYVNIGFAWRGHFENNPPEVPILPRYHARSIRTFT